VSARRSANRRSVRRLDAARRLAGEVSRGGEERGAARTLLLDLDGTLAPIAPTPDRARVPPRTLDALEQLVSSGWKIWIVSGRPESEVRELVPNRLVRIVGHHGAIGTPTLRRRVRRLARRSAPLAGRVRGARVEQKPLGVAFHDRSVARSRLGTWRRIVQRHLRESDLTGLKILRGKRVVEVLPIGAGKGRALSRVRPTRSTRGMDKSLVAVGDDRTDEDLFDAIRGLGLAVRVGRSRRTRAIRRLPSPAAVQRFLLRLAETEREES
jgi:trehalose 6-phosphate phosphatase